MQALEAEHYPEFKDVMGKMMRSIFQAITSSGVEVPEKANRESFPGYVYRCMRHMNYLNPNAVNLMMHVEVQALLRFIAFITGGDLFAIRFLELIQVSISTVKQEFLATHYAVNTYPA